MRQRTTFILATVFMLLIGASTASALPLLSGAFSSYGNYFPIAGQIQTNSLALATALDFVPLSGVAITPGVAGFIGVTTASGDFAVLAGTNGAISDFTFSGSGGGANYPSPVILNFEAITGLSVDLMSINSVSYGVVGGLPTLTLGGTIVFNMSGFDPTLGTMVLTANNAGSTFSYSASQMATQVPEPTTLVLVGMGLLGAAFVRRRQKSR